MGEGGDVSYSEKLKDPRWQKRRLQILQRDEWRCQRCLDDQTTLHVHHRFYERGKEPWDYEDRVLVTLCEECHAEETESSANDERNLLHTLKIGGALSGELDALSESFRFLHEKQLDEYGWSVLTHHITELMQSWQGDGDLWHRAVARFASVLSERAEGDDGAH
jgi:hypothetical protein